MKSFNEILSECEKGYITLFGTLITELSASERRAFEYGWIKSEWDKMYAESQREQEWEASQSELDPDPIYSQFGNK